VISSILALPPVQLHGLVTRGIPASQARILTKVFQLSVAEQKRILGLARRRGKSLGAFTEYQGDCLYRLLTLCQYAVHTLGSEQAAMKWLRSSHVALEGAKPIDMVASSAGTGAALKILGRPMPM
jgi:putative toxin-antitoxin system antitoxin component (TIGR02293 family)